YKVQLYTIGRVYSAIVMFVLIVKVDIRTIRSPPRIRLAALGLAVVVGAISYVAIRWGTRYLHGTIGDPANYWYGAVAHFFRALAVGALLTGILFFAARERETAR